MEKSEIKFSKELREYLLSLLRESEILKELREETDKDSHSIMQIPPEQGQFMMFFIKAIGAKKIIEIGTYTGYSTLCMALAVPSDGNIIACDIKDEWVSIGKKYWKKASVENKIDFRLGLAINTLDSLIKEGKQGSFDFIFIDADKINYDEYYEKSLQLLRVGGVIAIDNVLLFGSVVNPTVLNANLRSRISDEDIKAMRKLNEKIAKDIRIEQVILPIADGLTLVRKI